MEKFIEKRSIDTQVLINRLQTLQIGDKISYEELCRCIGADSVSRLRGPLDTARNRLLRDNRMEFGTIRGEGLVRLDDSQKIGKAQSNVAKIRRCANRGLVILQSVNYDILDKASQSKMNIASSHLGIISHATTNYATKKLAERVLANNGLVPPMIGLEAIK